MDVIQLQEQLNAYDQGHLLRFWLQLTPDQQAQLYNDIRNIDLPRVKQILEKVTSSSSHEEEEKLDSQLQPIPPELFGSVSRCGSNQLQAYREQGLRAISAGNVAVLLLAGGQGTRLGVNYPKGMYDVQLPSRKTLYQLQCERILRLEKLAYELTGVKGTIPWYIMTSEHTIEPTLEFFENRQYFGMQKENLVVFEQNMLPCFTFEGKIILESAYKIARAPDGNGGLYAALESKGILNDMERRGIKYVHVYCVDNILVKMADPVFIGYCLSKGANCAAKVVEKAFPTEAVGVVSKVNGKYQVVEYSELSLNTAQKRNPDGRLTFSAGNICNHFFTLDFLRMVAHGKELKHHIAKKKIPFIDDNGKFQKPEKPNGIKLEKFVFDVFQFSDKFAVWEVLREDEFSPLKNADGAEKDTPTTARHSLYNLHQRYVLQAGGKFVDEDGSLIPLIPSPVQIQNGCSNGSKHANGVNGTDHVKENGHTNGDSQNGHTNGDSQNGHSNGDSHVNGKDAGNSQKSYLKYEYPVICEISPLVSYDGEGLADLVAGKRFVPPLSLNGTGEVKKMNDKVCKTISNGLPTLNHCNLEC